MKFRIPSRLEESVRAAALRANYWLGQYREVVWLIGDGRSGTTWVADLLNHGKNYREMFEPFHHRYVDEMKFLGAHPYVRPGTANPRMRKAAADVFSGRLFHERVDETNRRMLYKGLLIKDIFANLFAKWASGQFPQVRIVLLVRNPFAVAVSKREKSGWYWMTDPAEFLRQPRLCEDHLEPFRELIEKTAGAGDFIQCQILIWAILHYVPFRQFAPGEMHVVFYEDVYADPSGEISRILAHVRPDGEDGEDGRTRITPAVANRPSRVSRGDARILAGISPVNTWKDKLTPDQIDAGREILGYFGFGDLYDDDSIPDRAVLGRVCAPA